MKILLSELERKSTIVQNLISRAQIFNKREESKRLAEISKVLKKFIAEKVVVEIPSDMEGLLKEAEELGNIIEKASKDINLL